MGTAENNNVVLQAEAFLGTNIVTAVIENKNLFNYVVHISDRNPRGAAGSAVLRQPAGFQFPVNPSKDSVTIGPNQKETITLTFSTRVNIGDQIIFQSVKSDVDVLPFSLAAILKIRSSVLINADHAPIFQTQPDPEVFCEARRRSGVGKTFGVFFI